MPYNHHIWKVRERAEPKTTKASQAPSFFGKRGKSVFIGKKRAVEKSPGNDLYETAQSSVPRGSEKSPMSMNIQLPSIISPNPNSARKNPVLEEAKKKFQERQQRKNSV